MDNLTIQGQEIARQKALLKTLLEHKLKIDTSYVAVLHKRHQLALKV